MVLSGVSHKLWRPLWVDWIRGSVLLDKCEGVCESSVGDNPSCSFTRDRSFGALWFLRKWDVAGTGAVLSLPYRDSQSEKLRGLTVDKVGKFSDILGNRKFDGDAVVFLQVNFQMIGDVLQMASTQWFHGFEHGSIVDWFASDRCEKCPLWKFSRFCHGWGLNCSCECDIHERFLFACFESVGRNTSPIVFNFLCCFCLKF